MGLSEYGEHADELAMDPCFMVGVAAYSPVPILLHVCEEEFSRKEPSTP